MESFFVNSSSDTISVIISFITAKVRERKYQNIYKVPKHICINATFTDFKVLRELNRLWSNDTEQYAKQLLWKFPKCKTTTPA